MTDHRQTPVTPDIALSTIYAIYRRRALRDYAPNIVGVPDASSPPLLRLAPHILTGR